MELKKPINVKIFGVGGVGGPLADNIANIAAFPDEEYFQGRKVIMTLYDGDHYEEKNARRQRFTELGANKAVHQAELISDLLERRGAKNFKISGVPQHIVPTIKNKKQKIIGNEHLFGEGDIVLAAVDRNGVRRLLSEIACARRNAVLISVANSLKTIRLMWHIRINGVDYTTPITAGHPDIKNAPLTDNPGVERCGDRAVNGESQIYATNVVAAGHATWIWLAIVKFLQDPDHSPMPMSEYKGYMELSSDRRYMGYGWLRKEK